MFGLPWSMPNGGGGGGGSAAVFTALNLIGIFPVAQQGALGDGVHNDRPNIVATDAAAAAFGSVTTKGAVVYFHNPPNAFMTDQTLRPTSGNTWIGEGTTTGQCILRASAAMLAVVAVTTTNYNAGSALTTTTLQGLTLDANGLATHALLRNSDFFAKYEDLYCENALKDGIHAATLLSPATIGAITSTVPGGSPVIAGPVTAPDPLYTGLFGPGPIHIFLKVADPGGYGVATFLISLNGGVTYAAAKQTIRPVVNLAGTTATTIGVGLGLQLPMPAGPYFTNDTYDFTVTISDAAAGSVNVEAIFRSIRVSTCGVIGATAGLTAAYGGILPPTPTLLAGTASTVAGSQIITFSVASGLLALGCRPGDPIFLAGWPNPVPILAVLNDFQVAIGTDDAGAIGLTLTNVDYAAGCGACIWSDNMTSGDNGRNYFEGVSWLSSAPQHMRVTGVSQGVARAQGVRFDNFHGFISCQLGGGGQAGSTYFLDNCEFKTSIVSHATQVYLGSGVSGLILAPQQGFAVAGPGNAYTIVGSSALPFGVAPNTLMPIKSEQLVTDLTVIETAADQIPCPAFNDPAGGSTVIHFTMAASFLMTAVPFITAPPVFNPQLARKVLLVNRSTTHTMTLPHNNETGNKLLLAGPQVPIGPSECLELFIDFNGFAHQLAPVGHNYASPGGVQARGSPGGNAQTTTNAPTQIYKMAADIFTPGSQMTCTLSARDNGGTGINAFWSGIRFALADTAAGTKAMLPGFPTVELAGGTDAGGAIPFGWDWTFTLAGGFLTIKVIGDNAHTVEWRINVEHDGAPVGP